MPTAGFTKSDLARQSHREAALKLNAERRGEVYTPPAIIEQPSLEELRVKYQHTFADRDYRIGKLNEVLTKMHGEIMVSRQTPARLVEVYLQACDGMAKEMGDRQVKSQVELSGQVDFVTVQEQLLQKLAPVVVQEASSEGEAS